MEGQNTHDIVALLAKKDITLFVKEDQLGIKRKKSNVISDEIIALIKANKEELISYLNSRQSVPSRSTKTAGDYGLPKNITNKMLKGFMDLSIHPNKISNIYPLTPLQEGFLFHNLYQENNSDYICQLHCDLKGPLSIESFTKSWEYLMQKHTVLRTAIFVSELDIPLQCVYEQVNLPVKSLDFSDLSKPKTETAFSNFLKDDREAGFIFEEAPLFRITLINLGENHTRFVFTHHHILLDGWSVQNLMKDFYANYVSIENGLNLPEPVIDDFGGHLKSLSKIDDAEGFSYWKEYLSELKSPSYLPFINDIAKRNKAFGNCKEEFTITGDINSFTKKYHITENTLLQGAWSYLLSKYTGNDDVVFGATVLGRDAGNDDVESKVGLYINTIPVCSAIDSEAKVSDWLQELQKMHTTSREEYGHLSLSDIEIQSPLNGALFDSIISFQNFPEAEKPSKSDEVLTVESIEGVESNNYSLSLIAISTPNKMQITLKYNEELISKDIILKIKAHLEVLLQNILSDVTHLKDLDYLSEEEKHELNEFNNTHTAYSKDESIIDIFSQNVQLFPDRTALAFEDQFLSYKELDMRSNQVAHYLISEGVIPGSTVGLMFDRSLDMIVAILGVLKTGSGYLPLDPNLAGKRIEYMLDQSRATFLLSQNEYLEEFTAYLPVQALDSPFIKEQVTTSTPVKVLASDLAYCIFTSGSTGKPKGVVMGQSSIVNLVKGLEERVYKNYSDRPLRVALVASYAFDASAQQIFASLLLGHSLYITDDESRKDGNKLLSFYNNHKIDVSDGTPTHLRLLVETAKSGVNANLQSLKAWILAGEVLPKDLLFQFYSKHGVNTQLYNFYGPTETCVDSTSFKVDPEKLDDYLTVPIGKPLPNERIYVTDKSGGLVPIGVIGELCIAGDGLAQRYVGDHSLTAEKFDSEWVKQEERVYRTGDMVKWLPDGNLEYHGRRDDQLKIRGFRIELTEIEHYLSTHPKIDHCVITVNDTGIEKSLVAYYQSDEMLTTSEIKTYLATFLPDYMIPAFFKHVDKFEFNANGKIDRKKLVAFEIQPEANITPPSNDLEKKLQIIFAEVLDIVPAVIGVNSNFFDLGGHSLRMMFLCNRIQKEFNLKISLKRIMENPSILGLSALMADAAAKNHQMITPAPLKEYYPLSSAQNRMYFLHELNKESLAYNLPAIVTLNGVLDKQKLEAAYTKLAQRHNSLRTSFKIVEGNPVQYIKESLDITIEEIINEGDPNKALSDFIRPFDLSDAPLYRIGILSLDDNVHKLVIDTHHIISDEVTNGILLKDLIAFYGGGEPAEVGIQYQDYVIWQLAEEQQEEIKRQKHYWMDKFKDEVTALQLPFDRTRPNQRTDKGGKHNIGLSLLQINGLKELATEEGVSMYSVILAIYNVMLSKISNQKDITIGTPVAGRTHSDLESVAGIFINTLPLRNYVDNDLTFNDFLNKVQEANSSAFENQSYPHEELIDALNLARDTGRNPLFDVFLNYEFEDEKLDVSNTGFAISDVELPYPIAKFDLHLSVFETEDNLKLSLSFSKDIFDLATVERFGFYFDQIINAIINDKNQLLKEIKIVSEEEDQLLKDFNDTERDFGSNVTVLDLFNEQVKLHGEKKAIIFNEQHLTYSELDERSTKWAKHLVAEGVTSGAVVALRMTRSIDMITALLSIMKAGAAYLTIDPDLPAARVNHMIQECACTHAITNLSEQPSKLAPVTWLDSKQLDDDTDAADQIQLSDANSKNLAYVLYTSGSTGKPKGCMISHDNLYNYIAWSNSYYFDSKEQGNWGLMSAMSFDLSVTAIFTSLTRGKKLYLGDEQKSIDHLLKEFFENKDIDTLKLTPTHVSILKNLDIDETHMKTIICGGEQIKKGHVKILKELNNEIKVYNEYGPTETTVGCSAIELSLNNENITIGGPIANTKIHILDDHLNEVPIGVIGHLYISGKGVSKGYIGKPELTKDRFITINNTVCYNTGDLGKWDHQGRIAYTGRSDDQIKIRGYRIEAGEIESILENLSFVERAFVTLNGENENQNLCAYLTGEGKLETAVLKEILSVELPDYMIPAQFVWLETFPYTSNGKIDIKALSNLDIKLRESYKAPENNIEKKLVEIWSQILDLAENEISVTANFLSLGGHSLNVIQMVTLVNKEFSVQIKLNDIFNGKTIRQLYELIEMNKWLKDGENKKSSREEIVI